MQSIHMAMLPFPQLPIAACQAHVLPALQNKYLLSIDQFCDSKFNAVFHKYHVLLNRYDITITGQRDPSTGIYYIDLLQPPPIAPPITPPLCLQCICNENQCRAYPITTPVCLQSSRSYLDQIHQHQIFRYLARPNIRAGA